MPNQRNSSRRRARRRRGSHREYHSGSMFGRLLIMLAVVAALVLGIAIFFRVRTVQVQGNRIYSQEQVVRASGVEAGDNLLMVNRAEITGNIKAQLPYVQSVSVGRILPDTVVIQIKEGEIAGAVQSDTGVLWYVNTEGRVMGTTVEGFGGQVVELTGFTITAPQAGQDAVAAEGQSENMSAAMQILRQMDGTGLIERVTAVNTEKTYDIELLCGEQYQVLLGGTEELDYKLTFLQKVLEDELQDYQTGTIDLTFDEKRVARFEPWE